MRKHGTRRFLIFTAVLCLLFGGFAGRTAAQAEPRMTVRADITGDGTAEKLVLEEDFSVRAYLVTGNTEIELVLDKVLKAKCLLVFGKALTALDPDGALYCFEEAVRVNPCEETENALEEAQDLLGDPGEDDDEDDEDDEDGDDEDDEDGDIAIGGRDDEEDDTEDDALDPEDEDEDDDDEEDDGDGGFEYGKDSSGSGQQKQQQPDTRADPDDAMLRKVKAGDHFAFGKYEQDSFTVNGKEPIIWRVLDVDKKTGNVLAVSEYGLHTMQYHRRNERTAWKDTDVRNWLNSTFLAFFTEEEAGMLVTTKASGSRDKVFLLSAEEIRKYLGSNYLCYATPWAKMYNEPGADVYDRTGASSWLVRRDVTENRITYVGGSGRLYVPEEGSTQKDKMTTKNNAVRPAAWFRPEAVGPEAKGYNWNLYAEAIMDLSTRSGPSTGYNGLGDYKMLGKQVKVLSRVNDGSIWWLQVEFEYNNELVRCYTGLKRIGIDISTVPDEAKAARKNVVVKDNSRASYGPGTIYKKQNQKYVPETGTIAQIVAAENGWVCVEYPWGKYQVRAWLPEKAVTTEGATQQAGSSAGKDKKGTGGGTDLVEIAGEDEFARFLISERELYGYGKNTLRVRGGPGAHFEKIGTIQADTVFKIVATYESAEGTGERWYKVERTWDGMAGFINAGSVTLK